MRFGIGRGTAHDNKPTVARYLQTAAHMPRVHQQGALRDKLGHLKKQQTGQLAGLQTQLAVLQEKVSSLEALLSAKEETLATKNELIHSLRNQLQAANFAAEATSKDQKSA